MKKGKSLLLHTAQNNNKSYASVMQLSERQNNEGTFQ